MYKIYRSYHGTGRKRFRSPRVDLIEKCWTDKHLLGKGIKEIALLEKIGIQGRYSSLNTSSFLSTLERVQATCLWEKERMYAYAVTRCIIEFFPNEIKKKAKINTADKLNFILSFLRH